MRGDGARGQEQTVGDLAVGQPAAGERDDLALLRGEPGERVQCGAAGLCDHAAGPQFSLRAPSPRRGAEAAERLKGAGEEGLGVVDPPPPPQPFAVVEPQLCPLEWPGFAVRVRQALREVDLGVRWRGEQPAGAGGQLIQPDAGFRTCQGQRVLDERLGLDAPPGADRRSGEVGDGEVRDVLVQWRAVGTEKLPELGVGGDVVSVG